MIGDGARRAPGSDDAVIGGALDDWILRRVDFCLVVVRIANWKALAKAVGMSRIDGELERLRGAILQTLPEGTASGTIAMGVFAYLVEVDRTAIVARVEAAVARAEGVEMPLRPEAIAGVAAHTVGSGVGPAELTFRATWALTSFSASAPGHVGLFLDNA